MSELERRESEQVEVAPVTADLERFQDMLLGQLAAVGLPTNDVLVNVEEREQALATMDGALKSLPISERGRSYYISKMVAAAAVGLFDAALNYLWNETVAELRRRVTGYDLAYFYDVAVSSADARKHLIDADDLTKVNDIDLLRGALAIGLLTSSGHKQLDHIRDMRNHASAAHPNQVELTGLQLATWLQTCVKQVITQPYDFITAETGKLLSNIKTTRLEAAGAAAVAGFFEDLPPARVDALAAGLFGLYVDPGSSAQITDNVRLLWPKLWPLVGEEARTGFGTRIGRYLANASTVQAAAGRQLLDLVDGGGYLPEQTRTVEIDAAVDDLLTAHRGWDNFANEAAPARALAALLGQRGDVPAAVEGKYIDALVEVYLGNAYGLSWIAEPIYTSLLGLLSPAQAGRALRTFKDPTISAKMSSTKPAQRWRELLDHLEPKLTAPRDRDLLEAVQAFTGRPDQLDADTSISRLLRGSEPAQRNQKPRSR